MFDFMFKRSDKEPSLPPVKKAALDRWGLLLHSVFSKPRSFNEVHKDYLSQMYSEAQFDHMAIFDVPGEKTSKEDVAYGLIRLIEVGFVEVVENPRDYIGIKRRGEIIGCNYRMYKDSAWIKTDIICRRCKGPIYREVMKNTGRKTKYFTCVKPECSWVEYRTDELIEQDSPVEYYGE
jgi:hypothetical protein